MPPHFPQILFPLRTKNKLRSGELVVSGDQWPIFLYAGYTYDPTDPWKGLLCSSILTRVCFLLFPKLAFTYSLF